MSVRNLKKVNHRLREVMLVVNRTRRSYIRCRCDSCNLTLHALDRHVVMYWKQQRHGYHRPVKQIILPMYVHCVCISNAILYLCDSISWKYTACVSYRNTLQNGKDALSTRRGYEIMWAEVTELNDCTRSVALLGNTK